MTERFHGIILQAEEISKSYRTAEKARKAKKRIFAVRDLTLRIKEGECRGIVGESGCGKSTLLRMLSGLEKPDCGSVMYENASVFAQMETRRNEIQLVFQNSLNAVNPYLSIEAVLSEPLKNFGGRRGEGKLSKKERRAQATELLTKVGLSEKDLDKYPGQFSGGQLQRICIARALAAEPKVLLLDEPLSSLDVSVQAQIIRLLEKLGKENRLTQVFVSHDLEAVYYLSDSLSVMYGGWIVEEIEEMKFFDQLCHPYTKRLVQSGKGGWFDEPSGRIRHFRRADKRNADAVEISMEARHGPYIDRCPESTKARHCPYIDQCHESMKASCCPYVDRCPESMEICGRENPPLVKLCDGHWVRCFRFLL